MLSDTNRRQVNFDAEISALKEQIAILQLAVTNIQEDSENKEKAFANLAREKEKLAYELNKQKRINTTMKQQLEDEREYYYNEKERYCQEMNDCKRIRRQTADSGQIHQNESVDHLQCQSEAARLKQVLNQTLEANYNLSVKFLRMKNTKTFLKERLKTLEDEYQKVSCC